MYSLYRFNPQLYNNNPANSAKMDIEAHKFDVIKQLLSRANFAFEPGVQNI
jgi:hypothetical protein